MWAVGTDSFPVFAAVVGPDAADVVVFADGFESGNPDAWSNGSSDWSS